MGSGSLVSGLEQAGFQVEGVGQAVRRIDAHHQRTVAEARKLQAGGRGNAGLAHASFAAEEQDAHGSSVTGSLTVAARKRQEAEY